MTGFPKFLLAVFQTNQIYPDSGLPKIMDLLAEYENHLLTPPGLNNVSFLIWTDENYHFVQAKFSALIREDEKAWILPIDDPPALVENYSSLGQWLGKIGDSLE